MFCTSCGTKLPEGAVFCSACGKPLLIPVAAAVPTQEPVISMPQEPVTPLAQDPIVPPIEEPLAPDAAEPDIFPPEEPAVTPVQEPVMPQQPVYQQPCQQQWQPTYQAPTAPAQAPKQKKERKPLTPPKGSTKAFTVILCIFMVLCLFASTLIGAVRTIFTEDVLCEIVDEIDFDELAFVSTDGEEQTLAEAFNSSMLSTNENYYEYNPIILTDNDINDIFELDEVQEFIVESILGYTDHLIFGEKLHAISAKDIANFVSENRWIICNETDKDIPFADKATMQQQMNDYFDFDSIDSAKSIEEMLGFDPAPITFVFSTGYYILFALAMICFILIIVINRKNLSACMTKVGVSSVVFSIWMLLFGLCALIGGGLIGKLWYASVISAVSEPVASYFLIWGACTFGFGLLLILVRKYILKPRFEAQN